MKWLLKIMIKNNRLRYWMQILMNIITHQKYMIWVNFKRIIVTLLGKVSIMKNRTINRNYVIYRWIQIVADEIIDIHFLYFLSHLIFNNVTSEYLTKGKIIISKMFSTPSSYISKVCILIKIVKARKYNIIWLNKQ